MRGGRVVVLMQSSGGVGVGASVGAPALGRRKFRALPPPLGRFEPDEPYCAGFAPASATHFLTKLVRAAPASLRSAAVDSQPAFAAWASATHVVVKVVLA